jgi:hypothetical protein
MTKENKLVCLPQKDIEAIYEYVLSRPAKEVLQVLKHFENIRIAEESDNKIESHEQLSQDNS